MRQSSHCSLENYVGMMGKNVEEWMGILMVAVIEWIDS